MPIVLRLPDVKARTGLSRSTIYLRVKAGSFPQPFSLGSRAVGWLDSAIESWIAAQAAIPYRPDPRPAEVVSRSIAARKAKAQQREARAA